MDTSLLHPQIEALRVGWVESVSSTIEIGRSLSEESWLLSSPCPGWRLKDLISHLIGIEEHLLNPVDELPSFAEEKSWIKNDFGRFNEVAVHVRRERLGSEILAEFADVVERRSTAWRQESRQPEEETFFEPVGTLTIGFLLWRRVFDSWAHNQDLRMPLGLTGDLDGKAAALVYRQASKLLPMTFAKKCGASIGDSIALSITGPGAFNYGAIVNEQGRGEFLVSSPQTPTVSIKMSTHDWYLLICARDGRDQVTPLIHGDQDLGSRVLENFAITP
jgi:uncharacterized protein (TIGR03083 family)